MRTTRARDGRGADRLGEIRAGFATVARVLAQTIGPTPRLVVNQVGRGCEALADSATVARRLTSLPGRGRSAGAAIATQLIGGMGRRHGDGGATAVILAQAIARHATRAIAAGAAPVRVREGIRQGVSAACDALKAQAEPLTDEVALTGMATAATADPKLGALLGEMLAILGPDGAVEVAHHMRPDLQHQYIDGARWRARPADRRLLTEGRRELVLADPVVVVADLDIDHPAQIVPLLELANRPTGGAGGRSPVLLVAGGIGDAAASFCRVNEARGLLVGAQVVLTSAKTRLSEDLADLALLTGAEPVSPERGLPPERARPEHAGRARRVLLERGYLTVTGGAGDGSEIATTASGLRARAWGLDDDADTQRRLWLRQARLMGLVGALIVGAHTEHERTIRTEAARRTIRLLRSALHDGVVPGGGVAYLDSCPAVRSAAAACPDADTAAGIDAVCAGLEAPFLRIVGNGGRLDPRVALHTVRESGPGRGVDTTTGSVADVRRSGIVDALSVTGGALRAAGDTAGLLVSAEVVTGHA